MTTVTDDTSTFHALLVGVNDYFPNRLSNGGTYRPLGGAVNDVLRVEALLEGRIRNHRLAITKLIGSAAAGADEAEWPTADNIRSALDKLVTNARPGDQVYLHFSGHGGRVATAWPELKGEGNFDEALVPIDIGRPDVTGGPIDTRAERYIRDVELAYHLDRLAQVVNPATGQRVTITLVLDCCHSGGATRSTEITLRRATPGVPTAGDPEGTVDRCEVSALHPFAGEVHAAMAAAYRRLRSAARAEQPAGTKWLPPTDSYVLLAACRDVESAIECATDGHPTSGVLTNAFLEALERLDGEQSWRTIYDRILIRVHRRFPSQTPQLLGDIDRHLFGVALTPSPHAFAIAATDAATRTVVINGGLALNVTEGTELGIYSPGTKDFSRPEARLAVAKVTEARGLESTATLDGDADLPRIEIGAPVIVEAVPLRRQVKLLRRTDLPATIAALEDRALAAIASAIERDGRGFVEICPSGQVPHYQVAVSPDGRYEVCDPLGEPLSYLEPEVRIADARGPAEIVAQLRRLGRYHAVLEMSESSPELWEALHVELLVPPPGWKTGQPVPAVGGTPVARVGDAYSVATDTWLWLRVTNRRPDVPVNVALLNLSRKWHVEAIAPSSSDPRGTKYITVAERPHTLEFQMYTPIARAIDILKLFVTVGDVDFPRLATAAPRAAVRGGPGSALDRLIDHINANELPATREVRAKSDVAPWSVREFRVCTVRQDSPGSAS